MSVLFFLRTETELSRICSVGFPQHLHYLTSRLSVVVLLMLFVLHIKYDGRSVSFSRMHNVKSIPSHEAHRLALSPFS